MPTLDLATAETVLLMGQPESWDGHGGKRIVGVPNGVLKKARAFFNRIDRPSERTKELVKAIDLVLADREANSPQQTLCL